MSEPTPRVHEGAANLEAQALLSADASVVESTTEGVQTFSIERQQLALKAEDAAHKRRLAEKRIQHELDEATKENDQRRLREMIGFRVVVGTVVLGLVVGFSVDVEADNADTRRFAQGLVTLLFGGIVGGLAGYFTGRVGK